MQLHIVTGPGDWERCRLSGGLRGVMGEGDMGLDHSPFGATIIKQLQTYAAASQPVPLKVNLRMGRPGEE